jgi:methylated-DNA-[protein]-cysteine S-methyltransferase
VTPRLVRYEAPGFGIGEVWLEGARVVWSVLPIPKPSDNLQLSHELGARLVGFFAGEADDFTDVELDFDDGFYGACQRVLQGVNRGEVVTYGELAALAGRPGAARAAGTFCARNRLAPFVPCHRVVAADGIGGYGSLGVDYKRRLLALEHVAL